MPYSYGDFKPEIQQHLRMILTDVDVVLDVGPGSGTYAALLSEKNTPVDCIEIHEPYIQMFHLREKYRNVHLGNVLDFDFSQYTYLIMGDVLEHFSYIDSVKLLERIASHNIKCLVAVPYLFEQGEEFGNKHEIHIQSDLTENIMMQRYPTLRKLFSNNRYGYYVNY